MEEIDREAMIADVREMQGMRDGKGIQHGRKTKVSRIKAKRVTS